MQKMATTNLRTSAVVGAMVVAATAYAAVKVTRHRRQETVKAAVSWLAKAGLERFTADEAGVFQLDDVNRSPNGKIGGAGTLRCTDTGENVPVSTMVSGVPELVLYSIEIVDGEVLLLFMQVPSVRDLINLPFLDRGVRKVAEIGSKVFVVRVDAVEKLAGFVPLNLLPAAEQSRFSMVWNTGRCGSTLMHRMLQKVGVLSFSEPYWTDRIFDLKMEGFDADAVGRIFGVCGAIDVLLTRKSLPSHPPVFGAATTVGAEHVSFNFKGKGFLGMAAVIKAMPHARHMLMYRDVRKVAESFGSIFYKPPSTLGKLLGALGLWKGQRAALGPTSGKVVMFSKAVAEAKASGALVEPSRPMVKLTTMGWMETMCLWKELLQDGVIREDDTITLRMDDYIRKDPAVVEEVLRFVLGRGAEVGENAVTVAMEAFGIHSQEGDVMAKSSHAKGSGKPRFLTPGDVEEIEAVARAVPAIGSPDYVFPGSLGAPN